MVKKTAVERMDALMAHLHEVAPTMWIDVWRVYENGVPSWRAQVFYEGSDLFKSQWAWMTWYMFQGKLQTVTFCSRDHWSQEQAVEICRMIVKGETVTHELTIPDGY